MTSKAKPAAKKRAAHVRNADKTKPFTKDWERLSRSGRYDMNRLKVAMTLLIANDGPLPPEYRISRWSMKQESRFTDFFVQP